MKIVVTLKLLLSRLFRIMTHFPARYYASVMPRCLFIVFGIVIFQYDSQAQQNHSRPEFYDVNEYHLVTKFDTHVHIYTDDESLIRQAEEDNFRLVDINGYLFPGAPPVEEQQSLAVNHVRNFNNKVDYVTTISVKNFNEDSWQQETIRYLKNSFAQGAVGVKVWKNIGMELRDVNGKLVMINDPKFDPVLDFIAKEGITLFSHQGEPKDCWLPLDEMILNRGYYSRNPQYHMYAHPDYPSYEDQIYARDHMVQKHPDLKIISVHLASLEWSVDEIAKRLDKFPNMAVDIAARISSLQYQAVTDRQKVYDFFVKYQDRILYGSDMTITNAKDDPASVRKNANDRWFRDWKFFVSDEINRSSQFAGEYKGLKLPREVVDKIYYRNAVTWIPHILRK